MKNSDRSSSDDLCVVLCKPSDRMTTLKAQAALDQAFDTENFHCKSLRRVLKIADVGGCDVITARSREPPHRSLLHVAAGKTCSNCCPSLLVIQLVKRGCPVDAVDDDGLTPLMLCTLPQVATVLLEF
eukprot:17794-Heterococcus_DN1.PRE.1